MSHTNPTASPERNPDTQALVALLEDLMPLLLNIQQGQAFGAQSPHLDSGNPAQDAMLDQQAAMSLVEDITADSLRTLSTYLETHARRYAELQTCVGLVTQAARCFAARDYAQVFGLIWQAYRTIAALRATNPKLPPLRAPAPAHASSSSPTTSIH